MASNNVLHLVVVIVLLTLFLISTDAIGKKDCFNIEDLKKVFFGKGNDKFQGLVEEICYDENKDYTREEIQECAKKKISSAKEKCKEENPNASAKYDSTIEMQNDRKVWTYFQISRVYLSHVLNPKDKKKIQEALSECEESPGHSLWQCVLKELSDLPCPEIVDFLEKLKRKKGQYGK